MFMKLLSIILLNNLDPTNYGLNFGIIALHEIRPRVNYKIYIKEYKK